MKTLAYVGSCLLGISAAAAGIFQLVALAAFAMIGLIAWNQQHKISCVSPPLATKLK